MWFRFTCLFAARARRIAGLILLLLVSAACAASRAKQTPSPTRRLEDTIPVPPQLHPQHPGEPIHGSFLQDAMVRFEALQGWLFRFYQVRGRMPISLDEFAPDRPRESDLRYDPWKRRVVFRVAGDSYEFRSAGEDGVFLSVDDVILQGLRGRREACRLGTTGVLNYREAPSSCPFLPEPDSSEFRRGIGDP